MKRRGFLAMLAALPALLLPRKTPAEPIVAFDKVPGPESIVYWMGDDHFHVLTAKGIEPLRYREPDPALLELTEQIRRDLDAEYVGDDKYLRSNTAWYLKEPEASTIPRVRRHANGLDVYGSGDLCVVDGELVKMERASDGGFRFPPRRCGPVKDARFT